MDHPEAYMESPEDPILTNPCWNTSNPSISLVGALRHHCRVVYTTDRLLYTRHTGFFLDESWIRPRSFTWFWTWSFQELLHAWPCCSRLLNVRGHGAGSVRALKDLLSATCRFRRPKHCNLLPDIYRGARSVCLTD